MPRAVIPPFVSNYLRPPNIRLGGSFCRIPREQPYIRRFESLHHYPIFSKRKRWTLNWMYDKPLSGYEAVHHFGPHTIQLTGIPFGITNQFIEERLRRFFSQFGQVLRCHSAPHLRDQFQSSGVAFVTFRSKVAALRAVRAHVKFPNGVGHRVVRLRNLETDVQQDHNWYARELHSCKELASLARQLYSLLETRPSGVSVVDLPKLLMERKFGRNDGGAVISSGPSVNRIFGSWLEFLDSPPMRKMFIISGWRRKPAHPLPPAPTGRAGRIEKLIGEMVHRGEWAGGWGKFRNNCTPAMQRVTHRSEFSSCHDVRSKERYLLESEQKRLLSIGDVVRLGQIPKISEAEITPAERYEHSLISAAILGSAKDSALEDVSMTVCSREEKAHVNLLLREVHSRKVIVSKRTLRPEAVEVLLRKVHDHARLISEKKRTERWDAEIPNIPDEVKRNMDEFFVKPPLPESIQLQSRPESKYRIYDERHIVSLQVKEQAELERQRKENDERLIENTEQRQREAQDRRDKETRMLKVVGFDRND